MSRAPHGLNITVPDLISAQAVPDSFSLVYKLLAFPGGNSSPKQACKQDIPCTAGLGSSLRPEVHELWIPYMNVFLNLSSDERNYGFPSE